MDRIPDYDSYEWEVMLAEMYATLKINNRHIEYAKQWETEFKNGSKEFADLMDEWCRNHIFNLKELIK